MEDGTTETEPDVPVVVKLVPKHDVALVETQESVDDWPEVIEVGLAERVAVGTGIGAFIVTVVEALADPPAPVQLTV